MKNLSLFALALSLVFFTACTTKRVYEPEDVKDDWEKYGDLEKSIIDVTSDVALLENRTVLTKDDILDVKIPEGYRLLANSDGWIISVTIDGKMSLQYIDDAMMNEEFDFEKTVAGASVENDYLAVLFADNEMALYSIASKELLLKEQGGSTLAVDARIVNPKFLSGVVVYPTLDGKIVIINMKTKKKLRSTIVSSEDNFNNVLSFNLVDQKIIAATAHKILSMSKQENREKLEIRNVAYSGETIFVATKHGEIISFTPDLQQNAKVKFPFAHFLGLVVTEDKVYALEKEGYLIVCSKDLSSYEIYEADIDEGFVFVTDTKIYVNDEYIVIE